MIRIISESLLFSHKCIRKHVEDYHKKEKLISDNGSNNYNELNNQRKVKLIIHLVENSYV